jgi:superfamily II DNA or RNA helicase
MQKIQLKILDEVNCQFVGLPPEIRNYLHNKSKIFNPANKFIPSVRLGRWDGKVPFFSISGKTYINLLPDILIYIYDKGYEIELDDTRTYNRSFEFDEIDNNYFSGQVWPPEHQIAGQPIVLRDHQTEAANIFLNNLQGIQSLPTSSGKSLLTSVLSKKIEKYGRSIVIVPNKDLITQTEKYYVDLGLDVGVYYGDRKDFFKTHTICTWQSLSHLYDSPIDIGLDEPVTFDRFIQGVVGVIVDECHGIRGMELKKLLCDSPLKFVPIRWAFTGTIPKESFDMINLTISIGDLLHKLTTSELQDKGLISQCDVKILQLIDTKAFNDYPAELDYLVNDPDRLKFISDLIINASTTGNVLVLVGRKESGKILEGLIPNSIFLSGASKSKLRKEQYDEVATRNNKVIIATSGIAAVGLDIPRINHLFLIEIGKSFVRVVQSIGRSLRMAKDKNHAYIFDICSTCKFSKRHLSARKKYYSEQEFPYTIEKITWQK